MTGRRGFRAHRAAAWIGARSSRGRRRSCSSNRALGLERAARACSTWAPAAARSRWRSRTSETDLRVTRRATSPAAALALARAEPRAASASTWRWLHADLLWTACRTSFDAVLCNPPYIAEPERPSLAPEIVRHEPPDALFAGPDGLTVIRGSPTSSPTDRASASSAIEVGAGQSAQARAMLADGGFGSLRARARPRGSRAGAGAREASVRDAAGRCVTAAALGRRGRACAGALPRARRRRADPDGHRLRARLRSRPSEPAVRRLYALKRRQPDQPAAVMFFSLEGALEALPELGQEERGALRALLPGPLTVLLANPIATRFPLACGPEPGVLGVRVPLLPAPISALRDACAAAAAVERQPLRRSARRAGSRTSRRSYASEWASRWTAGELPGTASTVLDLSATTATARWERGARGPARARISSSGCSASLSTRSRLACSGGRTIGERAAARQPRAWASSISLTSRGACQCPSIPSRPRASAGLTSTVRSRRSTPRSPRCCAASFAASRARSR